MATKRILKRIAQEFSQEGASFWVRMSPHVFECVEEWKGDLRIKQEIEDNAPEKEYGYKELGHKKIYYAPDYALVLQGGKELMPGQVQTFMGDNPFLFDILYEVMVLEKREKSHQLLITVAHTIASSMNDDNFLDIIIDATISALPAADKGFLFLHDQASDKLLVKSAIGFKKEGYLKTQLDPGEGITGKVFQTGKPLLLNGVKEIENAMSDMTDENFQHYLDAGENIEYPDSVISAPLLYQEKPVGVLMIDSFKEGAYFVEEDLMVLQALANHVSVAILHAKLFEKEKEQREKLQLTHQALQQEHKRLQQTTDLHYRLSSIATQGKGLSAIIRSMYDTVQTPMSLYDTLLKPIAVAGEKKPVQLPNNFLKIPNVKKAIETKKWQIIKLPDGHLMIVLPVFGTDHLLGFLCAGDGDNQIAEGNTFLLEYGATVLTLEWTKIKAIQETKNRLRGDLFDEILLGDINVQLIKQAQSLGLMPDVHYSVVVVNDLSASEGKTQLMYTRIQQEKWMLRIDQFLEEMGINGFVVQKNREIVIILPFPEEERAGHRNKVKEQIGNFFQSFSKKVYIGVGKKRKGLVYLGKSYREAKQCLELLEKYKSERQLLDYSEIGVYRFFLQHERDELISFVADLLGPIMDYDRKKQGDLLKTLLLYVKHDKDIKKITKELTIHYNTLYYRIGRIKEISGLSFEHSNDWFNIQLACQMYEYLNGDAALE